MISEFSPNSVKLLNILGEGSFGKVHKARLVANGVVKFVAVKTWYSKDLDTVVREAKVLVRMNHPNIVGMIGIVRSRTPRLILEYLAGGSLLEDLEHYANNRKQRAVWAYGIAKGMRYLHHELRPYRRHQDLAARNCLLAADRTTIKLADIGVWDAGYQNHYFAPDSGNYMYDRDGDYFNRPAPVRWMAPECVPYNSDPLFTRKNDVWAYGIVLFEIWTGGELPFEDIANSQVLRAVYFGTNPVCYRGGIDAPGHVQDLMDDCMAQDKDDRPNFKVIVEHWETFGRRVMQG
ncbi:ephrin type-A receptor 4a-like [Bradysia coprophila]|uniref:ephrin type-A receptor 4a-like n=1 Tax=Bradysia coprophila TaxID=38358 RepID=UPI00187D84DA|nr:ephrin type-A receptor 4a-like [Bradysia coprophila]